jgi:hypothetical protein
MERLKSYLNCGTISSNEKYVQYRVTKLEDIETKVIPFFKQYPLHSIKRLNFEDFCKIKELVESKVHLTSAGLEKIKDIKKGMNFGRK